MKKLFALISVIIICFSLSACDDSGDIDVLYKKIDVLEEKIEKLEASGGSSSNAVTNVSNIIGTWNFENNITITFKEDKTFVFVSKTENITGRWSASAELDMFFLSGDQVSATGYLEEVDGVLKINLSGKTGVKAN